MYQYSSFQKRIFITSSRLSEWQIYSPFIEASSFISLNLKYPLSVSFPYHSLVDVIARDIYESHGDIISLHGLCIWVPFHRLTLYRLTSSKYYMNLQVFYWTHKIKHVNNHHIENRAMTSFRASFDETLRESLGDSDSLGEIHVSVSPPRCACQTQSG